MEKFPDRQHVWLRSRAHGTYLHADEDGHGVSLSAHQATVRLAWVVHRWMYFGDEQYMLLHSAAYGTYLSATAASAPVGCPGFRVAQRYYDYHEDEAIRWKAIEVGGDVLLRRHMGYLRANGRHPPYNDIVNDNVVSVDIFSGVSEMMQWVVEPIPGRERLPQLPRPIGFDLPTLLPQREVILMADGHFLAFPFRGRSVYHLRNEVAILLGIPRNVSNNLVMYVRAGRYGRFTPLVVGLPRSRQTLVITADTRDDSLANVGRYLYETLIRGGVHLPFTLSPQGDFIAQSHLPAPPLPRQVHQKTKICRHWERGTCWYGIECSFTHGREELVRVPRPEGYKTMSCRYGRQ